jgi:uncharacterized protein (UPF0332 family)
MTLDNQNRSIIITLELEKSHLNLAQANLARDNDYWDLVANRLYYALFHAISALLIKNMIPVKSHKGAIMMFNYHFVRTQIFEIEEGKIVSFLQSKREEADYNCAMSIKKEDIEPYFELCVSIIEKIGNLCR